MTLITDIQKLEPGGEVVLFELDGSDFGADVVRFHGHAIPHSPQELAAAGANADQLPAKSIWWQGREYAAWPVQIEGIEANSDGRRGRASPPATSMAGLRRSAWRSRTCSSSASPSGRRWRNIWTRRTSLAAIPTLIPPRRSSRSGTWTRKPTRTASTWPGNWPRQVTLAASRSVGR